MPARNPKNIVYPDRQALLDEAVRLCENHQVEPTRQAVNRLLSDVYDERYEQGIRKGGTYFTEAVDRILDWSIDASEARWGRFVQDVLRAYRRPSKYAANSLYPKRADLLKAAVIFAVVEGATTLDAINGVLHRKWAEAYRRGVAKGGTDLSHALDAFAGWDGDDRRWDRFLADVAREVAKKLRRASEHTHKFYKKAYSFNVGDVILYGKYKNKKGKILSFGKDPKGNPTITVEPIPKGRKQNKTMGLFKIWKLPVETAKAVTARYLGR